MTCKSRFFSSPGLDNLPLPQLCNLKEFSSPGDWLANAKKIARTHVSFIINVFFF